MKCFLCHNAKCNENPYNTDVERIMRALEFDNEAVAMKILPDKITGYRCPFGVDIDGIFSKLGKKRDECQGEASLNNKDQSDLKNSEEASLSENDKTSTKGVDLSVDICGVRLKNPFLLSSSVVSSNYEMCARAFKMGWAGAALKTFSYIDINESSPRFSATKEKDGSFGGFRNIEQLSQYSVEDNLTLISDLKRDFPEHVVIASIMGRNVEEWISLAKQADEAGADVLELNFSCPNMEEKGTGSDVGVIPELCKKYTQAVRSATNKPILAKMTPNITDICVPARASMEGGADGIAAINTIKSITGLGIEGDIKKIKKSSAGGYSGRAVRPIALRFISELVKDKDISNSHISAMGGIYTWKDALEFMALGADSIQITTAVMEYGYRIIEDLISGLENYMQQNGYNSLSEIIGAAKERIVPQEEMERGKIYFPIIDKDKCVGCGRCYISCMDGGHQAIDFKDGRPVVLGKKCVGCHLCRLVCPSDAIGVSDKPVVRG